MSKSITTRDLAMVKLSQLGNISHFRFKSNTLIPTDIVRTDNIKNFYTALNLTMGIMSCEYFSLEYLLEGTPSQNYAAIFPDILVDFKKAKALDDEGNVDYVFYHTKTGTLKVIEDYAFSREMKKHSSPFEVHKSQSYDRLCSYMTCDDMPHINYSSFQERQGALMLYAYGHNKASREENLYFCKNILVQHQLGEDVIFNHNLLKHPKLVVDEKLSMGDKTIYAIPSSCLIDTLWRTFS